MGKFDGLEIEADKPERMPILHPATRQQLVAADNPEDVAYLDLYSGDSEVRRKHDRTITKRNLARRTRKEPDPEEIENDVVELFVVMTAGWRLISLDGKPMDVPFSKDNARELYRSSNLMWLREQADQWVSDRGNFLRASSPNLKSTPNTSSE
jgi:hypothetical protein